MFVNTLLIVSLVFVEVITAHDSYGSILAEQLNQYCALHVGGGRGVSNRSKAHEHRIGKAGPSGVAGPRGAIGRQGFIGPAGPQGLSGIKGSPGIVDYNKIDEMITKKIQSMFAPDCALVSKGFAKVGHLTGGVFNIYPEDYPYGTKVYCDLKTDGGRWTIFQRRMDGSVNFTRNWNDYVNGFGNLEGEFWMGLEKLHRLTSGEDVELRFDLEDWEGNTAYAVYTTFSIGDASTKYQLSIGGYSGTAGNGMIGNHNNEMFSTYDEDNDSQGSINCALAHKGGWWFDGCNNVFLNGLYLHGLYSAAHDYGIGWKTWKNTQFYSLKFTEMKFRPIL